MTPQNGSSPPPKPRTGYSLGYYKAKGRFFASPQPAVQKAVDAGALHGTGSGG